MARRIRVRVLGGDLKGRVLDYPTGREIRPSMQRLKSSVFESLGASLRGAVVADLYAGAGAIGIEALSRGARLVHFVERDREALSCLRRNLETCRIERDHFRVHASEVMRFLETARERRMRFGIAYADPPYGGPDLELLLAFLDSMDYSLADLVIIEHEGALPLRPAGALRFAKSKAFGQSHVTTFVFDREK